MAIDGQTATQVGSYARASDGSSTNGPLLSFWRASGTANTSIDVTFNIAAGAVFDARGALWTLNDAGTLRDFAADTRVPTIVSANLNLDVDTAANGVAAAVHLSYTSSLRTTTWTGLNERYDGTADSLYGGDWFSTADLNATPLTITATLPSEMAIPGTGRAIAGLAVSFNPAAAGSYDAATVAWAAAVVAAGGTASTPYKDLVDTLIVGLKADGIWGKLDRLWLFAAENIKSALIDIRAADTATAANSPTFTPDRGFTGNGSSTYIISSLNLNSGGLNYVQDSACLIGWNNTAGDEGGALVSGGFASAQTTLFPKYSGNCYYSITSAVGHASGVSASGATGLYSVNRSGPAQCDLYINGVATYSNSDGSSAPNAQTTNGSVWRRWTLATRHVNAPVWVMGGSLNATEQGNLYTRLRTYMTGVGVP